MYKMAARRQNRTRSRRRPDIKTLKKKVEKGEERCAMPRTKRSYKNTKIHKPSVAPVAPVVPEVPEGSEVPEVPEAPEATTIITTTITPEVPVVVENNDLNDEIDTSGVTYFVDEEGRYYYQPGDELLPLAGPDENLQIQESVEVEETTPNVVQAVPAEGFQTVTLVPSKDSNGELSYVLVVQEEATPIINVDIKQETPVLDVYNFEDEEEESPDEEEPVDEPLPTKRKRRSRVARANFTCNFCNYSSHRRYLLIRHMKSHSEERPHKCEVCERGFKTIASLQNHTNMHNGVKPHLCKHCQTSFTTSGELVRHVRYKHTYEKPHKCTECDYASVELSKLRRHVRCHTGERPYQCPHCTYASPDTFKLKRHLRTHTGEKPYKCDQCTMCFTQSNSLKAHRLIHNVAEKPVYGCELCPAKCGRKTDLRIHVQKLHTSVQPLKCKRCGKTFPDRYSCKMHNKTHDGEKCYKCDLCPYASTTQRHLKSHLLKHTDEKPFSCEECDQSFRQKQLLRRHQNLYHNPNYVPKPPKEKTHTCHECRRTFAHKGNLIRHLAIHDPDSGHQQRALALKIGRQKKVKYVNGETMRVLQEETRRKAKAQMLKIGMTPEINMSMTPDMTLNMTPELKRGELVTMDDGDGQQFVVLEVIQLEDGSEQHVAVVRPDFLTLQPGTKITEGMMIEVENEGVQNMEEVSGEVLGIGAELEEEEDEEEDMQTKMKKHLENKERAAAEASIKLEQEVDACFGFVEEDAEADEVFSENIIYNNLD